MSARQAARWKRAACPALARDSFSKSKIWRRNQGFGSHLGGLRVTVAQSSRWALAAPSARFAPSGASEPPKGVVPPQKWWPSVVAGHARSSSVTAPPASKCGCGVCPAPQARAKRAPRATRATPAQAFRAPLRRKKCASPHRHAHHPGATLSAPSLRRFGGLAGPPSCIPNPATCAVDSAALRQQGYLTPLPAREPSEGGREGSGAPPAEKTGASRAFPTRSTASLPAPR